MFQVYCDDVLVYDPTIEELALVSPVLDLALNDAGQFTFTVPDTHPYKDIFIPFVSTIEVYRNDEELLFTGRIIDPQSDFNNSITYTCEGALAYLNDSIQPQAEFHDITPFGYVGALLEVHNNEVPENRQIKLGAVTVTDPNEKLYRYTNRNSTLQELKEDIIDDLGGYCRIRKEKDGLYLDILEDFGIRNEQTIEFGENLIDFTKDQDYTDLCTVIIPVGAKVEELSEDEKENNENDALDKRTTIEEVNDGKDYIINDELYSRYGGIWKAVTWDDVNVPELLKKKAEQWFKDQEFGSIVIDTKAFDLSCIDESLESFHLGDEIRVISKPHGLDRWFLLSQMTLHLDSLSENTITLGGTGRPITLSGVTTQLTYSTNELDDKQVIPNKLIEQAINQATQLINSMTHGYVIVEPNEILIMDTDDPETAKNVWRWNMGGLGFSSNGYNGPFETAITMDGTIVGKFIAANSIAAEQLDVNYRTKVERSISNAESNANDYTDGKLKDYWTTKEVETYVQTKDGEILAGVNTTLSNYASKEYLSTQLSITENNIMSSVSDTFEDYSTTAQVKSLIKQSADSITSTVTNTLKDYATTSKVESLIKQSADSITSTVTKTLNNYSTTSQVSSMIQQKVDSITTTLNGEIDSLEQKVTTDGIFTTINNGLAGSKSISNTKFSMTRTGLTIQGGGITIKNNAGTNVLSADTSGNLTMTGDLIHYGGSSYKAIGITGHRVEVYAYTQSGNLLGCLGASNYQGSSTPLMALWSDYGDDLNIGTWNSSHSLIEPIIRLGSQGGSIGIHYISGTYTEAMYTAGNASVRFDHGLCTGVSGPAGINSTITINNDLRMEFTNGCLQRAYNIASYTGSVKIGDTMMIFSDGSLKVVGKVNDETITT